MISLRGEVGGAIGPTEDLVRILVRLLGAAVSSPPSLRRDAPTDIKNLFKATQSQLRNRKRLADGTLSIGNQTARVYWDRPVCPNCKRKTNLSSKGAFWYCSGYDDGCGYFSK